MSEMNTLPRMPLARSEFERSLNLLPVKPVNVNNAQSWLDCFSPAWLRGEPEAEPFSENAEANRQWRESQRSRREECEAALRKMTALAEEMGLYKNE